MKQYKNPKQNNKKRNPNNFVQPHVDCINDSTAWAAFYAKERDEQIEIQYILLRCLFCGQWKTSSAFVVLQQI